MGEEMDPLVRELFMRYLGLGAPQSVSDSIAPSNETEMNLPLAPLPGRAGSYPGFGTQKLNLSSLLPQGTPQLPIWQRGLPSPQSELQVPQQAGDIQLPTPATMTPEPDNSDSGAMFMSTAVPEQTAIASPIGVGKELPYQTYERLTGNRWTGGGSESVQELMRLLGVSGPARAASTNLSLQQAMLKNAMGGQ